MICFIKSSLKYNHGLITIKMDTGSETRNMFDGTNKMMSVPERIG